MNKLKLSKNRQAMMSLLHLTLILIKLRNLPQCVVLIRILVQLKKFNLLIKLTTFKDSLSSKVVLGIP